MMSEQQKKVARQIQACWPEAVIRRHDVAGPGNYTAIVPGRPGEVGRHFPHPMFGVCISPIGDGQKCEIGF